MKNTRKAKKMTMKERLVVYPMMIIVSIAGAILINIQIGSNDYNRKLSTAVKYKDYIYFTDTQAPQAWTNEALKTVDEAIALVEPEVIDSFVKDGNVVLLAGVESLGANVQDTGTAGETNQFEKTITIAVNNDDLTYLKHTILHEFGHYIDNKSAYAKQSNSVLNNYYHNGSNNTCYRWYSYISKEEYFADSYAAYKLEMNKTHDSRKITKEVKTVIDNTFNKGYKKYNRFTTTVAMLKELGVDMIVG